MTFVLIHFHYEIDRVGQCLMIKAIALPNNEAQDALHHDLQVNFDGLHVSHIERLLLSAN